MKEFLYSISYSGGTKSEFRSFRDYWNSNLPFQVMSNRDCLLFIQDWMLLGKVCACDAPVLVYRRSSMVYYPCS